jgi:CRP/FNR family cyclic AMP-dependent transcriptional regulator
MTVIDALRGCDLFRHFDRKELEELARIAEEVHLDKGTVLCEQGRVALECWVVLEGEAEVEVGGETIVGLAGTGEAIGEMGLLDHLPRSATVTARTPMVVLRIDGKRFDELLGASPLARGLLEMLSRRIRDLEHGRALLR